MMMFDVDFSALQSNDDDDDDDDDDNDDEYIMGTTISMKAIMASKKMNVDQKINVSTH